MQLSTGGTIASFAETDSASTKGATTTNSTTNGTIGLQKNHRTTVACFS
jgi:hypothetical protein